MDSVSRVVYFFRSGLDWGFVNIDVNITHMDVNALLVVGDFYDTLSSIFSVATYFEIHYFKQKML